MWYIRESPRASLPTCTEHQTLDRVVLCMLQCSNKRPFSDRVHVRGPCAETGGAGIGAGASWRCANIEVGRSAPLFSKHRGVPDGLCCRSTDDIVRQSRTALDKKTQPLFLAFCLTCVSCLSPPALLPLACCSPPLPSQGACRSAAMPRGPVAVRRLAALWGPCP